MKILKSLLIGLITLVLFSGVVYAADPLENPESLEVSDIRVFRNLAESGDMLYVFQYDIAYASDNYPADDPASDTILFRLLDTDGSTLLTSSTPYVYPFFESNGYGDGVSSFYFDADDDKPDWEDTVTIQIYGSPSYFSPAQTGQRVVTADRYTSSNETVDTQLELRTYVLLLCDRLETAYSDTGIILKTSSDSGIVLSQYGETYFRGAISGLQALCAQLFFIQVYVPEQMTVQDYDMSLADTYADRLATDDFGKGFTRLGEAIGVSAQITAALIFLLAGLGLCIWTSRKGWGVEIGMIGTVILGIFLALIMGDALFTLLMIGSLLGIMGVVWLFILKRA